MADTAKPKGSGGNLSETKPMQVDENVGVIEHDDYERSPQQVTSTPKTTCAEHAGEEGDYFCEECSVFTCGACLFKGGKHHKHKQHTVDAADPSQLVVMRLRMLNEPLSSMNKSEKRSSHTEAKISSNGNARIYQVANI